MKTEKLIEVLRETGASVVSDAEAGRAVDERTVANLIDLAFNRLASNLAFAARQEAEQDVEALRELE